MPPSDPRFPAGFDTDLIDGDLKDSTPPGRAAGEAAHRDYERDGVPASHLKPCEAEGRDGTRLPQCVKAYVPQPDGKWGMVFEWVIHIHPTQPRLRFVAFGVRHHPPGSNAPDLYSLASDRLSG